MQEQPFSQRNFARVAYRFKTSPRLLPFSVMELLVRNITCGPASSATDDPDTTLKLIVFLLRRVKQKARKTQRSSYKKLPAQPLECHS